MDVLKKKKVLHELLLPLSVRETGTLGFCTHLYGTNHEAVSMSLPEKKLNSNASMKRI